MNCWLEDRAKRFKSLFDEDQLINPFIAIIKPDKYDLAWLKKSSMDYLAAVINYPEYQGEADLLNAFEFAAEKNAIPNITPTGMILPKRHSSLQYNIFLRSY